MKCLPRSKIPDARGSVLHDCHAEIVALRAFNRYLIDECALLAPESTTISDVIEKRAADQIIERFPQPFAIRSDVNIHMYCSEAPCGDVSMELIMQAQEDSTPWELPLSVSNVDGEDADRAPLELKGRGYFSELGIVRRKPGTDPRFVLQFRSYIYQHVQMHRYL
jgi:tRNA-specific adenosine deaminase 1